MKSFEAASIPAALLASFFAVVGCAAPVDAEGAPIASSDNGESRETKAQAAQSEVASAIGVERAPFAMIPPVCEEPGRYVVRGDVVIDTANACRLWQRDVDPTLRTQPEAIAYCQGLVLGGRRGWRLPIVQELQTLRLNPGGIKGGAQYCMPSIDQTAFPSTPAAEFWSATTRDAGDGLFTEFDDGRTHPSDLETPMYVRCVHDASSVLENAL